ncbi:MAG: ParB/RepB/Spo0J family partition protein [Clostridiales bacterium]|jgi:ParB family chromosome partitioning protein|nr:ParB/RepB/Spo0J family partition protein [Clostridiales bacterium]
MKDPAKGLQDFIKMQHGEAAVILPIDRVEPNPDQPRKSFNEESLRELAASIAKVGVIQPILVCQNGEKYIIIAGERRYRATLLAGLTEIPAIIRSDAPIENQQIALIENLQREDLNPIEIAEAISDLIVNYKLTQEEVASALGKSRPVVTNLLRLLLLPPEVIQMVRDGRLSSSHARCLVVIDDKEILVQFARHAAENKLSVHDLETSVKLFFARKKAVVAERAKNIQSRELKDLVSDMRRVFATKVRLMGNDSKGRIYIDYFSRDDLQRIFELIEILKR